MVGILESICRIVATVWEGVDRMESQVMERLLDTTHSNDCLESDKGAVASSTEEVQMPDSSEKTAEDLRRQIACDIHDGVAQDVAGALYRLEAFRELVSRDSAQAWSNFDNGLALLQHARKEVRNLIAELRLATIEALGLAAAVEQLVRSAPALGGPEIEYHHNLQGPPLSTMVEHAVYRIIQEALTNARRHSRSEKIRLELFQDSSRLRISVEDRGVGFDPNRVSGSHFGLAGIRERAKLIGGRAVIDSAPGKGTRIVVEVPGS
ncbi:MAG: sensor histidine kinase [Thermoguttaceae bacterium]|jgi:signal transduction histidine kinase